MDSEVRCLFPPSDFRRHRTITSHPDDGVTFQPDIMATDPKLQPLHKTLHALKEIRSSLFPFLKLLRDDDEDAKKKTETNDSADDRGNNDSNCNNKPPKRQLLTPHKRAEAEAAVALSIGTLRYMGARLKGLDRGRKKDDGLRKELDQIRGLLVALRKIEGEEEKKKKNKPEGEDSKTKEEATHYTCNKTNNKSKHTLEDADDIASSKKQRKT